jgi:hypothetical protein
MVVHADAALIALRTVYFTVFAVPHRGAPHYGIEGGVWPTVEERDRVDKANGTT